MPIERYVIKIQIFSEFHKRIIRYILFCGGQTSNEIRCPTGEDTGEVRKISIFTGEKVAKNHG